MSVIATTSASGAKFRYGNPVFDCNGAQLRAQCRQLATVVTLTGRVDSANIDAVSQQARRFILAEKPFVLDMSGVNSCGALAIPFLRTVDEQCRVAGVEWALIPSAALTRRLRDDEFVTTPSVPDAMEHFADELHTRRRLLPLLAKTA
ncbi:STAS domain-containing protein [Mycolicibacterium komossense]|uniref:STAS domain-containing protein n=1 Tax=Mycolicibacterium komossense TaxID=1779 RepID=A0ABT3CIF1_9MYCO|nr:STAS domain-containing protein [Mycolicibacterium komossense]MCV7229240.1 STAS domain-containing protein [Mycolicibacterium komossense]